MKTRAFAQQIAFGRELPSLSRTKGVQSQVITFHQICLLFLSSDGNQVLEKAARGNGIFVLGSDSVELHLGVVQTLLEMDKNQRTDDI